MVSQMPRRITSSEDRVPRGMESFTFRIQTNKFWMSSSFNSQPKTLLQLTRESKIKENALLATTHNSHTALVASAANATTGLIIKRRNRDGHSSEDCWQSMRVSN